MTLGSSLGLDNTMALMTTQATKINMTLVAAQLLDTYMATVTAQTLDSLVASGGKVAVDSYTDPGCGGTMDPDTALGGSLDLDVTLAWVTSRPPTSAYSSSPSFLPLFLFPQHMNHPASLSLPFLHNTLAHHIGTHLPGSTRCWSGL
ncbi:hypothetical protein STEG23_034843 [Scotinomys teguina]